MGRRLGEGRGRGNLIPKNINVNRQSPYYIAKNFFFFFFFFFFLIYEFTNSTHKVYYIYLVIFIYVLPQYYDRYILQHQPLKISLLAPPPPNLLFVLF